MAKTPSNSKNVIAFQGIPGAHSDLACRNLHPYMDTLPCRSFEDVFRAVEEGKAELGLIPIENTHAGRVAEIHNLLPNSNLFIIGEYFHQVAHHLMGPKGATLDDVKEVHSHPQALMQCREHLKELNVETVPFSDTAAAAKQVGEWGDSSKAALASDLTAELYDLELLKENMQDSDNNRTLFVTIAPEPLDPEINGEMILTSLIFTTRNIPAGLYKALGGFATNSVNLIKLESYMSDPDAGVAQFFVSFEGHPEEKRVQLAMEELGFFSQKVKVLGVYPADKTRYAA